MAHKIEPNKTKILDDVIKIVKSKSGKDQLCAEFIYQFFGTVPLEDLESWTVENLAGAAMHFWSLIKHRKPNETKICIYNPELEIDGWETSRTVIEVITTDIPFLVDSMRMTVNRLGLSSHLIIHMGGIRLTRDKKGHVNAIYPKRGDFVPDLIVEAPIFMEIEKQLSHEVLEELNKTLHKVLEDNHAVVEDWQAMREQVHQIALELDLAPDNLDLFEVEETKLFLKWIEDHHFTFLGVRDYRLVQHQGETHLEPVPNTGLGVLRPGLNQATVRNISAMTPEARELSLSSRILMVSKTNTRATVHRDAYTDYIGIKRFNQQGQVIGERRIIGLYTSTAYNTSPRQIPFLRHKVALIMQNSLLNPRSHAGKVLLNILETFPRDDLIQASEEELLEMSMGIFHMQERRRIRMFARMDMYHRFVSCLVYVPKDRYTTQLRRVFEEVLADSFTSHDITFSTYFSESVLARIHFIVRIQPKDKQSFDFKKIEKRLIEAGRSWVEDLQHYLDLSYPEEQANALYHRYKNAFANVYMSSFSPNTAVLDIADLEKLSEKRPLVINFYQPRHIEKHAYRLKLYRSGTTIALSDVLPILENLGMRAISERPYVLHLADESVFWINEFALEYSKDCQFNIDDMRDIFQETFERIWFEDAENDGFNKLVLSAGLNWRQVSVLRAYAKYFKQIGFTFSQEYIESALNHHPEIAKKLAKMFEIRFNPNTIPERQKHVKQLAQEIKDALENVINLDEDKIIRQYMQGILATIRTNYYQIEASGQSKNYISMKIESKKVPGAPRPYPLYEIFVYSPRFEGVHLRGAKVARGGLRWSDRKEDFRTEILGLMKAQQVKNAVIVPSGAKGGFVLKKLPLQGSREETLAEGIACYQFFIRGLLDITDNFKDNTIVPPQLVYRYDEDDPYLVVAADKGTASFSDIANAISAEYQFWLGDAFASGGSVGYDHKKMGITAKGAWESVKRHFYEMGINTQTTNFTVVGIGDMAGDVFGNGMLLSEHIQLIAAFNHQHIFLDPNPDVATSYAERSRLFHLPRSTWEDYDSSLISEGGGVFSRAAKSIALSPQIKAWLNTEQNSIEPNELIRMILHAQFDLLWSAGIGTFVKAHTETHLEVGDRSNDLIRVNASELKCRVVGEGGNLGFTQLARVEYALQGGRIYTDFIDNSAGVSCSDKEVNIKILLNKLMINGHLSYEARNQLLLQMTTEVSELVLRENFTQTRAISLISHQANRSIELHNRYLNTIEQEGKLDRALDHIPEEKELMERKVLELGLTAPEIATLLAQSKIHLKEAILKSDVPEEPYVDCFLVTAFPQPLQEIYLAEIREHPLKREIIATRISNLIVNEMGFSFIYRMQDETNEPVASIVKAYLIARAILNMEHVWKQIEAIEQKPTIEAHVQMDLMVLCVRLLRRTTRWFLRSKRTQLNIHEAIQNYANGVQQLKNSIPKVFGPIHLKMYEEHLAAYLEKGLSKDFAVELTCLRGLFSAMDIIDVALEKSLDVDQIAEIYFNLGELLDITWLRMQIIAHPTENQWESYMREALRDELDWLQRQLSAKMVECSIEKGKTTSLADWTSEDSEFIKRWQQTLGNLRASPSLNYTMYFVAVRELSSLTQVILEP